MTISNNTEIIESLSDEIAENIYIQVAKWHLYLGDAKLSNIVAEKSYPLIIDQSINKQKVTEMLNNILVGIGEGNSEISLTQLLPQKCQQDLLKILQEFQDKF